MKRTRMIRVPEEFIREIDRIHRDMYYGKRVSRSDVLREITADIRNRYHRSNR